MSDIDEFLNRPLELAPRQPIRIAVYSRLASGIRNGTLPAGTLLPRESELADMLGVSRTPAREALILLEEDGLITTKRGVGRFVATSLPVIGLEKIQPFERTLANVGESVVVKTLKFSTDPATEYSAKHLGLEVGDDTWFRESLIMIDGQAGAIVQEHLPTGYHERSGINFDSAMRQAPEEDATLLAILMQSTGLSFGSGECLLTASTAGKSRAALLDVPDDDPVIVLTETVSHRDEPVYLGKYIIPRTMHGLSVIQSGL